MTDTAQVSWSDWNQRQLVAALEELWQWLARDTTAGHAATPAPRTEPEAAPPGYRSALDVIVETFGLSTFERALLLLCAGIELDSRFAALLEKSLPGKSPQPTFSFALAALPESHWSALAPAAPLRRWHLLEAANAESLTRSSLRIDERVLHYLCGLDTCDERLRSVVRPCPAPARLVPTHAAVVEQIVRLWSGSGQRPVIQLLGTAAADQRAVAAAAAAALGLGAFLAAAADLPSAPADRDLLSRLWEREALLADRVLLLDTHEAEPPGTAHVAFLNGLGTPVLVAGRDPLNGITRPAVRIEVPRSSPAEQQQLWVDALGPARAATLGAELEAVAQQFQLEAETIHDIAQTLPPDAEPASLWQACRLRVRGPLESLAQRLDARARWEDLILPPEPLRLLHDVATHVRQRSRVYDQWGFAQRQARGLGISALFSGPSGTGKTMAAEVLANDLQLDVYRIDLSAVVNKYIGETEKNLRRIFDAAENVGAILLFDEADALFGKRSEVKDSHDRYANIEVSYLLQRMESYRGLAILTTNMRKALDPAFLRRIRFVISFPFPDPRHRAQIWQSMFPAETPLDGVDPTRLAQLNLTGGSIRNVALGASFLAADERQPVRMAHVLRAARSEYEKLEKPLTRSELAGWPV